MSETSSPQLKVGLFVLAILLLLAYATIRISQSSLMPGSTYPVYIEVESAVGITHKTPVQIAGIQVGYVTGIELAEHNRAKLKLTIDRDVKLSKNVQAHIKTIGFLGDTYIELYQPGQLVEELKADAVIDDVRVYGDFSSVTDQISSIANDVKAITTTMKTLMAGEQSAFSKTITNIEQISSVLSDVSTKNHQNLNAILSNMRALSENLNLMMARNVGRVDATLDNVQVITDKVRRGEGTLGRLVNDDQTVDKLNQSIDQLNDLLGGANKLKIDIGYRSEYLGVTEDLKHYISMSVKPRPDKYFLFEFVDDPAPDSSVVQKNTQITTGGVTTSVSEEIETINADKFRFSAQFAKQFYNLTLRGGLIESSGGVGIDYDFGPLALKFSAFDFETKRGERPHLKATGQLNLTDSFYMVGGVDDFISKQQDPDWFVGAGLSITDDDIKSLIGLFSLKP